MDEARQVRDFWFGPLPLNAGQLKERSVVWWGVGETLEERNARDETIRARFGSLIERAAQGELDSWAVSPRRRLSLILVLDQFPRSIYRGTRWAFAHDAQALQLALTGIQSSADAALDPFERMFFYMPLQHSEALEAQDESVIAFRRLRDEAPAEVRSHFEEAFRFAEQHRDVIARFGRFPHRNRLLGRVSTDEEREFLKTADSWGQ